MRVGSDLRGQAVSTGTPPDCCANRLHGEILLTMTDDPYADNRPGQDLIQAGADIAGSAAGAALGFVFGGPAGAIAGAVAGPVATQALRWVADEIGQRVLGPRERMRAGAAVAFAAERLEALLAEGATIRTDGFFNDTPHGRNAAREIAEGVVLVARQSFEERKVRHIGYLFARVAIDAGLDNALAAYALRRAESLTWRQYVILAAVGRADRLPLPPGELADREDAWLGWGARREIRELNESGYLGAPRKKTPTGLPIPNTTVAEQRLTAQGQLLYALLSLDDVPDADVMGFIAALTLAIQVPPDAT